MSDHTEYDAQVRHSIFVERRKARVANEIVRMINSVTDDLYGKITASDLETLTRRQLDRLLREIEDIIRTGYDPIKGSIVDQLREFGFYEAEWQARLLEQVGITADIAVPSDADIWAAVNARPFEGKFLEGWLDGLDTNTVERVQGAIRQGYVEGIGPLEIARQIRGTRARKGIMDISKRGAEMMVRTAMAHTAAMATQETYRSRRSIKEEYWVSVLDHRTSPICRELSGKFFPKNKGPYPPQHVGCRSRRIAATKGNRAMLAQQETYQQWLARQSAATQDDILGPTRGKLYREGDYTVDRFVDESGQQYTLEQLKAKDAETFADLFGDKRETVPEELRRLGRESGNEHFILERGGEVVLRGTSGDARKVTFTREQVEAMSDPSNPVVLHHNHPANAVSFSPADMAALAGLRGVEEITAFAYEADFSARRTPKTSRITKSILARAEKDADKVLAKAYNAGAPIGDLLELKAHAMSEILSRRGYIRYSYKLPDRLSKVDEILRGSY